MDNLAFGHSVGDTLLLGHGLALPLVPGGALLNRFLRDLASSLLDISTGLVRDISALLSGHRLVGCLGNLVADFLGHLTTHWLRRSRSLLAGIELVGDVGESQEKRYDNEVLHLLTQMS